MAGSVQFYRYLWQSMAACPGTSWARDSASRSKIVMQGVRFYPFVALQFLGLAANSWLLRSVVYFSFAHVFKATHAYMHTSTALMHLCGHMHVSAHVSHVFFADVCIQVSI